MLTFGHVHDLIVEALNSHFTNDETMANANERARAARVLVLLDRHLVGCEICDGLNVDSEYSRVGVGLTHKQLRGDTVFPDILLHRRTLQSGNVLAVEFKLRENSRPRRGPDGDDAFRIDIMTGNDYGLPDQMAPYAAGLCLNMSGNTAEGWWTVPRAALWHEHERFALEPSSAIVDALDTVLWLRDE